MATIKPLSFSLFDGFPIKHAFSTRLGGSSKGKFHSLNFGLNSGDDRATVEINRNHFFASLAIDNEQVVYPQQTHSANIAIVNRAGFVPATDSLITSTKNIALTIQTADCFPVFIYDKKNHVCAIVHSGWRGTAQNIVGKTLQKMKLQYASNMGDVFVGIGPGVHQKNYQVDVNTAQNFNAAFLLEDTTNHFKLDVQAAIIDQIMKEGLPRYNLEVMALCTYERADLFYSYRRDGLESGRMMGVIELL